jgi:phospholipid transport system substrate-binding protein
MSHVLRAISIAALLAATPAIVAAQPSDPAASRIDAYNQAVVSVMKDGPKLGIKGRTDRFQTIVDDHYAIPAIAQVVVGQPSWGSTSQSDRTALIAALTHHSAVSLASNFDSFSNERFSVNPQVKTRGTDRLVSSTIASSGGNSDTLIYRMRQIGGQWRIR